MLVKVQEPTQHFKAYYQDNSLLIQLMMTELSAIHQLVPFIISLKKIDLPNNKDEYLAQLQHHLATLIGELEDRACASVSRWSKGPLTRLKEYCEQFFRNAVIQNKNHLNLSIHVYQIWLSTIFNLQLIHQLKTCCDQRKSDLIFNQIQKAVQTLLTRINLATKHFLNGLKAFNNNENVIFFLMRKKDLLIKIYGFEQVNKLFKSFSKKQSLSKLLIGRFKSRGFDHLLPTIKQELFLYESYKHIIPASSS